MHVASLELCKQLYEMSGWETGTTGFCYTHDMIAFGWVSGSTPAYDLGYLLRKLEQAEEATTLNNCHHQDGSRNYCATYGYSFDSSKQPPFAYADAPEDAAAKLCIELFKQGVLS